MEILLKTHLNILIDTNMNIDVLDTLYHILKYNVMW